MLDIHRERAAVHFNKLPSEVTRVERAIGKRLNHAEAYNATNYIDEFLATAKAKINPEKERGEN